MRDADERDAPPRLKPKRHKINLQTAKPGAGRGRFLEKSSKDSSDSACRFGKQ